MIKKFTTVFLLFIQTLVPLFLMWELISRTIILSLLLLSLLFLSLLLLSLLLSFLPFCLPLPLL